MEHDMEHEIATGMAWYFQEQWDRIRAMSEDRAVMEEKYEDWESNALAVLARMEAAGETVHRVYLDADLLQAWCRRKGRPVNGYARSQYVSYLMAERLGNRPDP
ncbi:MAG: hypothetical protein GX548_05625 [Lentisphaerae bacterium]|nr:hypothetical protein [Lentisphaerota bacterium]